MSQNKQLHFGMQSQSVPCSAKVMVWQMADHVINVDDLEIFPVQQENKQFEYQRKDIFKHIKLFCKQIETEK